MMRFCPPRTFLATAAALTLTASVLAPTAVMAKGPGSGDCVADCPADQPQVQQRTRTRDGSEAGAQQRTRARDEFASGQQTATQANAGDGGQVRTRVGQNGAQKRQAASTQQNTAQRTKQRASQARNQSAYNGPGKGPRQGAQRGPGTCDDCGAEMGVLSAEQAAGLVYMANEEKLAHDVYTAFAELYGTRIFGNIAESEARHQQAVNLVLERYELEDTAIDLPLGEFSDPTMASLYQKLVEQGSQSMDEALAVGAFIEETDIADLESRLVGLEASAPDVFEMYSNLLTASGYHLSAFEAWLS